VVRIMMATEPKLITITVYRNCPGEYVEAVGTCATRAIAQRRPTQLFLRDVPPSTRADALFWPASRRRRFACVSQEFTVSTSLQKSVNPLRRAAYVTRQPYVHGESLDRPTEHLAFYWEGQGWWDCRCAEESGTCLGRRCHGWVWGRRNQSVPLAVNMHIQLRKENTQNVGGMVS